MLTLAAPHALLLAHVMPPSRAQFADEAAVDAAMSRYADGDEAAFATLYDLLSPRLLGALTRMTRGDRALAEDLTQQTFLQIHRARGEFREGAHVVPWAFAIARRLAIDVFRKRGREDVRDPEQLAFCLDWAPGGDQAVLGEQLAGHLDRVLAEMPETQVAALELVRGDGLSMAEAAEVLGLSEGAVKVRVHRGLTTLRAALDKLLGGSRERVVSAAAPTKERA